MPRESKRKSRQRKVDSRNRGPVTKNRNISRMVGQFIRSDTLDRRRKHDYERSDEGPRKVKTTLGPNIARSVERTERHYVDPRTIRISTDAYKKNGFNACQPCEDRMTNSVSRILRRIVFILFLCCIFIICFLNFFFKFNLLLFYLFFSY